jgi:hypothetical protein
MALFAFKGDHVAGPQADIPSVIWSQEYFHQTNQLRVCTQVVHDQALAADPAIAIVGPFAPADAGTDVRRVRGRCAYVPPRYIGLFLAQDLTPQEACERGCAAIENDGLANELEDLCFWLRAAMSCQVAGADSPLVVPHPIAPVSTPSLSSHRRQLLFLDLPALGSTSVGQGAQHIAGAVSNLMDQQRHFHQPHQADTARRARDGQDTRPTRSWDRPSSTPCCASPKSPPPRTWARSGGLWPPIPRHNSAMSSNAPLTRPWPSVSRVALVRT